jgi:predicted ester cyclase
MTSPDVALERLLDAVNAHDLDAIAALAPDNERLRESNRRMLTAFPDVRVDVEWTVAEGSRGVAWARITGTHEGEWRGMGATRRPIDVRGIIALEVDPGGRVTDFWLINDWLGIATQIGARLLAPET